MAIRITCINKSGGDHQDPHHAISDLGWVNDQDGVPGKITALEYDPNRSARIALLNILDGDKPLPSSSSTRAMGASDNILAQLSALTPVGAAYA